MYSLVKLGYDDVELVAESLVFLFYSMVLSECHKDELLFSSSYSDASCFDRTESPVKDKAYGSDLSCCYSRRGDWTEKTIPAKNNRLDRCLLVGRKNRGISIFLWSSS